MMDIIDAVAESTTVKSEVTDSIFEIIKKFLKVEKYTKKSALDDLQKLKDEHGNILYLGA